MRRIGGRRAEMARMLMGFAGAAKAGAGVHRLAEGAKADQRRLL